MRNFMPKVEMWDIDKILPYALNSKKHPDEQIAKLASAMVEFGMDVPVVVDADGILIKGHARRAAAIKLGLKQFPVIVRTDLSPTQVKASRLADNRIAQSEWDNEMLALELGALDDIGFDLDLTGFDPDELDALFAGTGTKGNIDPDEVPEAPVNPVTVLGDVWIMGAAPSGGHRLVCGDSTDADTVNKVLKGVKPHLMVTDPPYGVEYDADWRNKAMRADGTAIAGRATGKVLNDDKVDWREAWALFPGDVAYVWCAPGPLQCTVHDSLVASGIEVRQQIIWAKSNFAIGRGNYHYQHEVCWYAVRKGKTSHYGGDRKQTTLWEIQKPAKSETGHSTQKPVECMKRPIENNSSPGQAIYDPFVGSGTTIIAGEMTGRHVYAIELNPAYVDVAVKRWSDFTGEEAILEDDGQTFEQICKTR